MTKPWDMRKLWIEPVSPMPNTQLRGNIGDAGMQIKPSKDVKSVYKLLQQKQSKLNDQDLLLTKDYISVAKDIGIKTLDSKKDIRRVARSIHQSEEATDQPQNLVIFIRD